MVEEIGSEGNTSAHNLLQSRPECRIRENLDTNVDPNKFQSKNLHERISEYACIKNLTRTIAGISICLENCMNIRIFVESLYSNTLTNECPDIFVPTNLIQMKV